MAISNKNQYIDNLNAFSQANGPSSKQIQDFSTAAYGGEVGSTTYADKLLEFGNAVYNQAMTDNPATLIVNCQITEIPTSAGSNVYKVTYQDNPNLSAITVSKEVVYEVGQSVSVLVPDGDFSNELIIIGLHSTDEEETMSDEEYFEQVSPNLVSNQYEARTLQTWVPANNVIELSRSDVQLLWNSLFKENNKLCFSLDILTDIDDQYRGQGNYGLIISLPTKTVSTLGEQKITEYGYQDIIVFDTSTMLGGPYAYDIPSTQKFYIDINPDIQYVTYSELEEHPVKLTTFVDNTWTYPSGYTPVGKEYDVEFSNLQIYEVKPVPEEYQTGYYFILTAPEDGTLFVDNTGTIKLVPLLRYRMKEVGLTSKDYLCYWFRKNSSIKADSKKYLPIGGRGWEVLNGVLEDDDTSYVNDEFEYIVKSSEVYLKGEYKCVLVPVTNIGENQTPESLETGYFEAEITLDKLSAGIDISLTSDAEGITCNSTAIVTLVANIKYQATEEPVIIFNYSRYNQDNNYVEDNFGEVKSTIVKETEGTLTNTYEIEQRYSFKAGIGCIFHFIQNIFI